MKDETLPRAAIADAGDAGVYDGARWNSYDRVPDALGSYPQTHPDRLATVATLLGLSPPAPQRCRVLELGCGRGGNLIPMALTLPGAQFVGVDLAEPRVANGRAMVSELALKNVELRAQDILDIDDSLGTFDYVICHGVYSWATPEVQRKILQVCRRNLAPQGVAYVSYNTLPGSHGRGDWRAMLRYHVARFTEPADRVREARALIEALGRGAGEDTARGKHLRGTARWLGGKSDAYLLHEHLGRDDEPLYFHQFAERAAAQGLQYLGEANFETMALGPSTLPGPVGEDPREALLAVSSDLVHREQYEDFVGNRVDRQTLLCHAGEAPQRPVRPSRVARLYVASPARPASAEPDLRMSHQEQFSAGPGLTLTTGDPDLKAAMSYLWSRYPGRVKFVELLDAARRAAGDTGRDEKESADRLAMRMLHCHAGGIVEFSLLPAPFTTEVSERPVASPYARLLTRTERNVTTMRLEQIPLPRGLRPLLAALDGTRDRADLIALVAGPIGAKWRAAGEAGKPPPDAARVGEVVDALLRLVARAALLVG